MALGTLQSKSAINTGAIAPSSANVDNTVLRATFLALNDTPGSYPTGGTNFVKANSSGILFSTAGASEISFNDTPTNETGADIQAFLENLDTKVESNKNSLTPNATETNTANVDAAGAVMDGDFSSNGLMQRTAAGTYSTVSTGLENLTSGEVTQLQNIDSVTITNTQWGYLGGLDQSLSTSDSPTFNEVNGLSLSEASTSYTISGGSTTARTLTMDTDLTASNVMTALSDDASPTLGGDLNTGGFNTIFDGNGNEILKFTQTANADNHLDIVNQVTSSPPLIRTVGADPTIPFGLNTKNDGDFIWNGVNLTKSQWDNFVTTMDQDVSSGSSVGVQFKNILNSDGYWSIPNGNTNEMNSITGLANAGTSNLSTVNSNLTMYVIVMEKTGAGGMLQAFCDSNSNTVTEVNDPTNNWGVTSGAADAHKVYHDGSNFVLENNSGSSADYIVKIITSTV